MRIPLHHVELPNKNGTTPPGLSNYNFPLMNSLGFYRTSMHVSPHEIGRSLANSNNIQNIMIEYCNITALHEYFFDITSSNY
jgi:hypothetical protein